MAISYVGGVAGDRAGATTTTTQSLSGTLTGGSNTSPQEGDLVVVWCSAGADTTAAPNQTISGNTSGAYSNEALQSQLGTTYDAYAQLNWQFMGVTPDTSITIPSSGSARNAQRWAVHVFRGVDAAVWDQTSTTASGTASGRPNPPSITPNTAGAWILWLGASSAGTGAAYTAPTDFATNWRGGTTVDTADCMNGFGYYTGWTSGAYDPAAITAGGTTNAADAWVAKTAVLKVGVTNHTLTAQGGSYTKTGGSATLKRSKLITASGGAYSLAGQQVTITKGAALNHYTLTANGGAYSLAGQNATVLRSKRIQASGGSYSLAGQSATVLRSKRIQASGGNYTIAGQQITITYTPNAAAYVLTAQGGSYSVTGQQASLNRNRVLVASSGSYTVTGQQAVIKRNRYLITSGGSYSLAGQQASIRRDRVLSLSGGSYSLVGQNAIIKRDRFLTASGGSYLLTGQNISFNINTGPQNYVLVAQGGSYVVTGQSIQINRAYNYPPPHYVYKGIMYGPTGTEYVGTFDGVSKSIKLDVTTGNLVKPINDKLVMSL